jgi:hypothetical protein
MYQIPQQLPVNPIHLSYPLSYSFFSRSLSLIISKKEKYVICRIFSSNFTGAGYVKLATISLWQKVLNDL